MRKKRTKGGHWERLNYVQIQFLPHLMQRLFVELEYNKDMNKVEQPERFPAAFSSLLFYLFIYFI